jgi:serine/threonine protein kinase
MATGKMPFDGSSSGEICGAILHQKPIQASQLNPQLPAPLEEIIENALQKDRNLRYQRAADMRTDLQQLLFDLETQKEQPVPGIEPEGRVGQWTEDGKALLVYSGTPWETRVDRVEVTTGKRTPLQKVELKEKAGSTLLYLQYAERSKTSVYVTLRFLGSLYVVEGLE